MPKKTCAPGKWIPCAINKPGALHRMLHIPQKDRIPDKLLEKVISMKTDNGSALMINGHIVPITPLLKQRASLALTLRRF